MLKQYNDVGVEKEALIELFQRFNIPERPVNDGTCTSGYCVKEFVVLLWCRDIAFCWRFDEHGNFCDYTVLLEEYEEG